MRMRPSVRRYRYSPAVRGLDGVLDGVYRWYARQASIGPKSRRARRFGAFGTGSGILFPTVALYGEPYIRIGRDVIVGPDGNANDLTTGSEQVLQRKHRNAISWS